MDICQTCGACFDDGFDFCAYDGGAMQTPFAGPRVLGERYLLEQRLASGAMGVVFRATHLQLGSTVALKLMQPRKDELQVAHARFHREAQILGQIKHPNAVLVMDFGVEDRGPARVPYLVMEFLRGETLEDVLERKPRLSLEEAERILSPLCDAVEEAHQVGVVHRDIKPSNVLLERLRDGHDVVKVVDFGIAKFVELSPEALRRKSEERAQRVDLLPSHESGEREFLDELMHVRQSVAGTVALRRNGSGPRTISSQEEAITEAGFMVGTLPFMAPEQITGGRISRQTDVYAIASLLFRMVGGQLPFEGDDDEVIAAKLSGERPTLKGLGIDVPPALDDCLQRCFSLQPADRPQSVLELAEALRQALKTHGTREAEGVPSLLRRCNDALVQLAVALEVFDAGADVELHYGHARDGILVVDDAVQLLRRGLASHPVGTPLQIAHEEAAQLDAAVSRVARALSMLHTQPHGAGDYVDYLGALWARLHPALLAISERLSLAQAPRAGSFTKLRTIPFRDVGSDAEEALRGLAQKLAASDALDSSEALESALTAQLDALMAYLARGAAQPDALCESLVAGLWRHSDALLLLETYPVHRPLRLLPLITSLARIKASAPFSVVARLFGDPRLDDADPVPIIEQEARALETPVPRELWRCLLLHPSSRVRAEAIRRLDAADFWTTIVHPRTPIVLERELFEHVVTTGTNEYLRVFFLCVRENLESIAHPEDLPEAFKLLQLFFSVPCFHEDVVFEPLLNLDRALRTRASTMGVPVPSEDAYIEALGAFSAGGVIETQAPAQMLDIPLPIQRRLAREGHFLPYFVAHTNERVARETLPHLFRMEDVTRYLRIVSIHRAVLVELAKNRRFFRQEAPRLALLQNPKTPAHIARQYLPFIAHEQLRFLAANRHIGNEVRQLASAFLEKLHQQRQR